jgi:hypothetical protein
MAKVLLYETIYTIMRDIPKNPFLLIMVGILFIEYLPIMVKIKMAGLYICMGRCTGD